MLYHGPVRVAKDAQAGKAVVRVRLSDESEFYAVPTDIEVTLVE
jgi:hypothetical protein